MDGIPHKIKNGLQIITRATLKKLCPEAEKALKTEEIDHNGCFWVITEKPKKLSAGDDDDREEWSQTNEPELGVWLAEEWERYTVPVGDVKVIFLCGSLDDEYGRFWDNTEKEWVSYNF